MEGPPARGRPGSPPRAAFARGGVGVAYIHFGARLARPDRFDSCTLYQFFRAGSSTDQNSWPTPPTDAGSTPERRTMQD